MSAVDMDKVGQGGAEARQGFVLAVKTCSIFCAIQHPEMDEAWFMRNTTPDQVNRLAVKIRETLSRSLESVEGYQKN
jgi:hypothetical protein